MEHIIIWLLVAALIAVLFTRVSTAKNGVSFRCNYCHYHLTYEQKCCHGCGGKKHWGTILQYGVGIRLVDGVGYRIDK